MIILLMPASTDSKNVSLDQPRTNKNSPDVPKPLPISQNGLHLRLPHALPTATSHAASPPATRALSRTDHPFRRRERRRRRGESCGEWYEEEGKEEGEHWCMTEGDGRGMDGRWVMGYIVSASRHPPSSPSLSIHQRMII